MLNGVSRAVPTTLTSTSSANAARLRKPSPDKVLILPSDSDLCGPTPEEVEAASKELGNVSLPNEVVITEVVSDRVASTSRSRKLAFRTGPSAGNQSRGVQQRPEAAAVGRCVDLFQRSPDVQAAVMSLTRDPAVWNAFVRNEQVQELLRGNREKRLAFADAGSSLQFLHRDHTNPFLVAVHCFKNTVYEALDTLVDAVHGVFGYFDRKLFGGRDTEPLDRPLKAYMVLTILLFSLVLLNRGRRS